MGRDDFHKKRKVRSTAKKRVEKKAVLIALEDTKSSKYYFQDLIRDKELSNEVIIADHIGTDPNSVVEAAVQHLEKNKATKYEKVWIAIDKDDWSKDQINGAIQRAKDLKYCIAISNEAYELWLLLHFESVTASVDRGELNRRLNKHFKVLCGKEYRKSTKDVYRLLVGFQLQAVQNAEKLFAKQIHDYGSIDPFVQNPLTTMYQLVSCLNSLYAEDAKCDCFPLN